MRRPLITLILGVVLLGLATLAVASLALSSWGLALGGVGACAVGAFVLSKQPGNGVGRALFAFGAAAVLSDFAMGYMAQVPTDAPSPLDRVVVTIGASVFCLVGTTGCALLLIYPTGRTRIRWRWVLKAIVAVGFLGVASGVIWSLGRPVAEVAEVMTANVNSANPAELAAAATFGLGFPLAVVSLLLRYRAAGLVERAQLRWLMLAAVFLFVTSVAQNLMGDFDSVASQATTAIAFLLFPIAVGVAIMRYRLFEIDRIISRTATYALVTAVLVGVYALVAIVPAVRFELDSDLLVAAATLAAAAMFVPVQRRVQAGVDRHFNRSRYDARRVADNFASRLRDDVDLYSLVADLRIVVTATVQPATVSLWMRHEVDT